MPHDNAFTVIIPARMASTRLPGKPLADIAGLPMVVRVAQQAAQSHAQRVIVATDSDAILQACAQHQVQTVRTRADHPSGSDRLGEACAALKLLDNDIVVNVQGDEPLIAPELINAVAHALAHSDLAVMSTAAHPITDPADLLNPNVVKVALDAKHYALYFSRACIPWPRDAFARAAQVAGLITTEPPTTVPLTHPATLRHLGIYGYRVGFLKQFPTLTQAPIEITESLEQLRVLWHGHRITVHVTHHAPGPGVDTPEDLERVRALLA